MKSNLQAVTPAQTAARLLTALEDFIEREGLLLRAREYARAAALQKRLNPLVVELCRLCGAPGVGSLIPRIHALVARRREHLSGLAQRREVLQRERGRIVAARERLRRMTSYARPALQPHMHRLNAAV